MSKKNGNGANNNSSDHAPQKSTPADKKNKRPRYSVNQDLIPKNHDLEPLPSWQDVTAKFSQEIRELACKIRHASPQNQKRLTNDFLFAFIRDSAPFKSEFGLDNASFLIKSFREINLPVEKATIDHIIPAILSVCTSK